MVNGTNDENLEHLPFAVCDPVTKSIHGITWECPGCNTRLFIWDNRAHEYAGKGGKIAIECEKCGHKHATGKKMILTPNDVLREIRTEAMKSGRLA